MNTSKPTRQNRSRSNKAKANTAAPPAAPASSDPLLALLATVPAGTVEQAQVAATAFAAAAKTAGVAAVVASGFAAALTGLLTNKKSPVAREGGLLVVDALCDAVGLPITSVLMAVAGTVVTLQGDKKSSSVRAQAEKTCQKLVATLPAVAVPVFIRDYVIGSGDEGGLGRLAKWQTKVASLKLLSNCSEAAPLQVAALMTTLVPLVSELMWDTKKQVKAQATACMKDICDSIDNIDLEPFIPALIESITNPKEVSECIYKLAGNTFVQTVTASALSITVPLLSRGFKERNTAIKRKCAVITENMAKLVKRSADVAPFMPVLAPALAKGLEEISDPECRERFQTASDNLNKVFNAADEELEKPDRAKLAAELTKACATPDAGVVAFVAAVAGSMCTESLCFSAASWTAALSPLLACCFADQAAADAAVATFCAACARFKGAEEEERKEEDDGDSHIPDLCDLHFSLAYGSNILLNDTRLHLKKGYKYGIIANKSAGKTTMMRAITNGQVEGFPSPQEVRTIFIENDIQGDQMEMNVVQYLLDTVDTEFFTCPDVTVESANAALDDGGFTKVMKEGPIVRLSGGWKMKLALVRATLQKADIMLMDEPTNHLDVINVQWVVDYIKSSPASCLIVSHDTKFLDNTVTSIIHFDNLKLTTYKGNVTAFVERFPEAKSYFELKSTKIKFKFPKPGPLAGVKTKNTAIMIMKNCSFTYPSATKPQLTGVSVKANMASRVAIVGANGAGKSTMIKLLTGENEPTTGEVKKHPNCRFAYVAQHAFHHIEQHLSKSPNEYIRWRYETGEDKEALQKNTLKITEEEQKIMEAKWEVKLTDENGNIKKEKRVVERLMARRTVKKQYMYEVKWESKSMDDNMWYDRLTLAKKGFEKLCKALDNRISAQEAAMNRPLTAKNVEAHLADVGLEAEYATHSRIKDLSGGQKVKVVLAACTWACPHIIILDEPTNYLDRDSLGALANAITEFEGGVVLITHNKEFADATTKVTWVVANNRCDVKGDPEWEKYAAEQDLMVEEEQDTFQDACGNTVKKQKKIPKIEEMSRKEVKTYKKALKQKIKMGEELETYEMMWADQWKIDF